MDPQLSDKYESLFDDIGCLQGKYEIKIDPNVTQSFTLPEGYLSHLSLS